MLGLGVDGIMDGGMMKVWERKVPKEKGSYLAIPEEMCFRSIPLLLSSTVSSADFPC